MLFDLTTRFAKGLNGLALRIEHLSSENVYTRVISLLLYLAAHFGSSSLVDLPLTHQEVASLTGSTRETVSRQIERLKKKRLITYKRHTIVIKNPKKLKRELSVEV